MNIAWIKGTSKSMVLAVTLMLGLAIKGSAQVQPQPSMLSVNSKLPLQWEAKFRPPQGRGNPDGREGGATRGPECIGRDQKLVALVPPSGFGSTISNHPTFLWFVPRTTARQMEFILRDQSDRPLYSSKFMISGAPGIMSLKIPAFATVKPLEVGQEYTWEVVLICNPADSFANVSISASVQKIEAIELVNKIQQGSPQAQIAMFADAGVWYETVTKLHELRAANPSDRALKDAWIKLLKSVGLETLAQEPRI